MQDLTLGQKFYKLCLRGQEIYWSLNQHFISPRWFKSEWGVFISLIVTIAVAIVYRWALHQTHCHHCHCHCLSMVYRSASWSSSFMDELCISLIVIIVYQQALQVTHHHDCLSMSFAGVSLLGLAWAPPWPRFSRNQNQLHFHFSTSPFPINHSSLNITIHHPPFNIATLIPFTDASLEIPVHNPHYHSTSIISYKKSACAWSDDPLKSFNLHTPQEFHFDLPEQDSAEELLAERDSMIRQLQETVLQHITILTIIVLCIRMLW